MAIIGQVKKRKLPYTTYILLEMISTANLHVHVRLITELAIDHVFTNLPES